MDDDLPTPFDVQHGYYVLYGASDYAVTANESKAEIPGLFPKLPPSIIKAWVDGDIENVRHDPETGRFSFSVAARGTLSRR